MSDLIKNFSNAFIVMIFVIMMPFRSASQGCDRVDDDSIGDGFWERFGGHGVEGLPISMLSAWGMVALSGVIINDAVVFLSKYNSLLLEGFKVQEAVFRAGIARFQSYCFNNINNYCGSIPDYFGEKFPGSVLETHGRFLGLWCICWNGFYPYIFSCNNLGFE